MNYHKTIPLKFIAYGDKSYSGVVECLEELIEHVTELQADHVTADFDWADDGWLSFFTEDEAVARKHGMEPWEEE